MARTAEKLAPVVSILNMKGGVGKTTISAHVFRHLYLHLKKSVALIDFDPQFNLTQTVVSQADYEKYKSQNRTVLSVMEPSAAPSIFNVSTALGPPPALGDVSVTLKQLKGRPEINLSLVPGDFGLVKYSLIGDQSVLLPVRSRFLTFVSNVRKERDLVCIDCNPSSSFMTVCALLASTHVLVPVRPDRYSLMGLELLDQFIATVPELIKKPKILVVLNGLPTTKYDPAVEYSLRSHPRFGPATLSSSLRISKLFEASAGYTGFATDRKHKWRVTGQITALADELRTHLGLE